MRNLCSYIKFNKNKKLNYKICLLIYFYKRWIDEALSCQCISCSVPHCNKENLPKVNKSFLNLNKIVWNCRDDSTRGFLHSFLNVHVMALISVFQQRTSGYQKWYVSGHEKRDKILRKLTQYNFPHEKHVSFRSEFQLRYCG